MEIAIIGTGDVGTHIGNAPLGQGHEVVYGLIEEIIRQLAL